MTKWDTCTCLLSTAPAGLLQMVILADDIGADVVKISYFQLVRLLTIFLILQPIFQWYLN